MTDRIIEFSVPVSRIWSGVSGVVLSLASGKLMLSSWDLTEAELRCAQSVGAVCGHLIDLSMASVVGSIACAIFALRNLRDAVEKKP